MELFIDCSGPEGNAFSVVGMVADWLKHEMSYTREDLADFREDCFSGSYNELLSKCEEYTGYRIAFNNDPRHDS